MDTDRIRLGFPVGLQPVLAVPERILDGFTVVPSEPEDVLEFPPDVAKLRQLVLDVAHLPLQ